MAKRDFDNNIRRNSEETNVYVLLNLVHGHEYIA